MQNITAGYLLANVCKGDEFYSYGFCHKSSSLIFPAKQNKQIHLTPTFSCVFFYKIRFLLKMFAFRYGHKKNYKGMTLQKIGNCYFVFGRETHLL